MKTKSIDELCKQPDGSFEKFVQQKREFLQSLENERKERIRAARRSVRELSWAA